MLRLLRCCSQDYFFIAFLRYIDHRSHPSCRTRRPLPAACRPKFISVTAWGVRSRGVFNLVQLVQPLENCYKEKNIPF